MKKIKTILVTGAAGFIGYHISHYLLKNNWKVLGVDSITNYYDQKLKIARESILKKFSNYMSFKEDISLKNSLFNIFKTYKPNFVLHLAAQAGVRNSLTNPRDYLKSNIIGTFELLEACKAFPPSHLVIASTSSVYGNIKTPTFKEIYRSDQQISFYASSKKATENFAHSYSHIYKIPTTVVRFFTVYGPWGRPDMALFKFTKNIYENKEILLFNHGNMIRDFTYIDDLTKALNLIIKNSPQKKNKNINLSIDTLSDVAPFRVVNIGGGKPVKLIDFIKTLEKTIGKKAKKKLVNMQIGDVASTHSDVKLLYQLTGYKPDTDHKYGIKKFVEWYNSYYNFNRK